MLLLLILKIFTRSLIAAALDRPGYLTFLGSVPLTVCSAVNSGVIRSPLHLQSEPGYF